MAKPAQPIPVKLFAAVLFVAPGPLQRARAHLQEAFGDIDYTSPAFAFAQESYYTKEMGSPISRIFYSFRALIDPAAIVAIKQRCNAIEERLARNGKRSVNIDAGYLDYSKVILASMKYHSQKIYLSDGVYADLNLLYEKGRYIGFDWTFPDFKSPEYHAVLLHMRARYKSQLRHQQGESTA